MKVNIINQSMKSSQYSSSDYDNNDQEDLLLLKQNTVKNKILKNRLKIITLLNIITLIVFAVAMSVNRWVWIQLHISQNYLEDRYISFWANLLFMVQDGEGSSYETFIHAEKRVCGQNIECQAKFYNLAYVGGLSFSFIAIAGCLQIFDFIRMLFYIKNQQKLMESTHYFRHIITIVTYLIGITLSVFGIIIMQLQDKDFGVCFWISVSTLSLFISLLFYEEYALQKMKKQALIQKLIGEQNDIMRKQMMNDNSSNDQEEAQKNIKDKKRTKQKQSQSLTL